MSILIKGLDMPKEGWYLDLIITSDGYVSFYDDDDDVKIAEAVELPDHGDLINRDKVVYHLAEWSKRLIETYGKNDEYVKCLSEVLEWLGCDEVVIPAERSEE